MLLSPWIGPLEPKAEPDAVAAGASPMTEPAAPIPASAPTPAGRGQVRRRWIPAAGFVLAWLAILAIALAMARLIPAFQSPDEAMHLHRADMLAHGHWLLEKSGADAGAPAGGPADLNLVRFAQWMAKIATPRQTELLPAWLMDQASRHGWAHERQFVDAAGTAWHMPLVYLPHAAGLALSRHMDWSMRASYDFTRALVTVSVLALLAWAWQLLPPNLLVRALVLMPMTVFQIVSPGIDGLCIALALVLGGLAIAEYQHQDRPGTTRPCRWRFAAIAGCTFVLVSSRAELLPLLALPLLLLCQRFTWPRLAGCALLCAASLGWTLFVLLAAVEMRTGRAHTTLQMVQIYLNDPLYFLGLVGSTLAHGKQGALLADSFVGILGWLDTAIPRTAMRGIWLALLGAALLATAWARQEEKPHSLLRAVLLACAAGSALLAFFAIAVTGNDHPVPVISGLQGRHFIVPALLFALALGPMAAHGRSAARRALEGTATLAMAGYCLFVLASTLVQRYQMVVY